MSEVLNSFAIHLSVVRPILVLLRTHADGPLSNHTALSYGGNREVHRRPMCLTLKLYVYINNSACCFITLLWIQGWPHLYFCIRMVHLCLQNFIKKCSRQLKNKMKQNKQKKNHHAFSLQTVFSFISLIWLLEAHKHLIGNYSICDELFIYATGKSFVNSDF